MFGTVLVQLPTQFVSRPLFVRGPAHSARPPYDEIGMELSSELGSTVLLGGSGDGEELLVGKCCLAGSHVGTLSLLGLLFRNLLGMLLAVLVGTSDGVVFESTTTELVVLY